MNERIVCTTYSEFLMKVKEMTLGGDFSKDNGGLWLPQDDPEHDLFGIMFYRVEQGKDGNEDFVVEHSYHVLVPRKLTGVSDIEMNPLFREVVSSFELVQFNLQKEIKKVNANGVHQ